ncbi:MAG: ribose 5-phosphate isomerase B [Desulfobacterota bacterium]|nr:ribose 5-phosphate isomerase B [Thermodesulfobacteriota bacterium]MDW8002492.1 ribose 5-phosphate isomerase B [Deltaproteobacteria bacterium]
MRIVVGSDHAGFGLKEFLKIELQRLGHEIVDVGTYDESPCDYPDFGFKAAKFVSKGEAEKGILVCGTGIGMCVVANKVKKIRAALVYDLYGAIQSRKHLNSNVLVLGARMTAKELALEIVKTWLKTEFDGGRHAQRIKKIEEWEGRCSLKS